MEGLPSTQFSWKKHPLFVVLACGDAAGVGDRLGQRECSDAGAVSAYPMALRQT